MKMLLSINKKCFISLVLSLFVLLSFTSISFADVLPFGQYKLNDYAGSLDVVDSASSWTGIASQYTDVLSVTGLFDKAFEFSGTHYFEIPDALDYRLTADFSFSFWVNFDTNLSTWQRVLSKWSGSEGYIIAIGGDEHIFLRVNGDSLNSTSAISLNTWHHIVVTNSYTGVSNIYIDGELDNTGTTGTPTGTEDLPLYVSGYDGSGDLLNGMLDDLRFYDVVLDSDQVLELYNGDEDTIIGGTVEPPATTTPPLSATSTDALLGSLNFGIAIVIVLLFVIIIGYIFNSLNLKAKKKY